MTTKIEKKMIGQFYTLMEENIKLKEQIKELEEKLIASNHRNLDLQYENDSLYKHCQDLIIKN